MCSVVRTQLYEQTHLALASTLEIALKAEILELVLLRVGAATGVDVLPDRCFIPLSSLFLPF